MAVDSPAADQSIQIGKRACFDRIQIKREIVRRPVNKAIKRPAKSGKVQVRCTPSVGSAHVATSRRTNGGVQHPVGNAIDYAHTLWEMLAEGKHVAPPSVAQLHRCMRLMHGVCSTAFTATAAQRRCKYIRGTSEDEK